MPSVACTAPPVLIAHLAALTSRIRVGSGGVMLPNHAPLVVAEQFAALEALHPGRIDLGIGRAPGTDYATAAALRRSADSLGAEDFPRHLLDVMGLLGDERLPDGLSKKFHATPAALPFRRSSCSDPPISTRSWPASSGCRSRRASLRHRRELEATTLYRVVRAVSGAR